MERKIAIFQKKEIRKLIHEDEWWFVVQDVVLALIESRDPKQYIQRMKQRDPELAKGWVQIVHTLPVPTDGGPQPMLCANTEGLFRIIQSIPSPRKPSAAGPSPLHTTAEGRFPNSHLANPGTRCFSPPSNEQGLPHLPIDEPARFPSVTTWHALNPPLTFSAETALRQTFGTQP